MAGRDDKPIHDMLQRFARAFTTGDGPGAAACWEVPALIVMGEGPSRAVATLDEVGAFFGGAAQQYTQQGVTGTRADVQSIAWHADRLATVTVRWPYLDAEGRELKQSESSAYIVRIGPDGKARISAVLMLGVAQPAG
jgi:hypothetical protein